MPDAFPPPPADAPTFAEHLGQRLSPASVAQYLTSVNTLLKAGGSCGWGEGEPNGHEARRLHVSELMPTSAKGYVTAWNHWCTYAAEVFDVKVPALSVLLAPISYEDHLALDAIVVIRALKSNLARRLTWAQVDIENGIAFDQQGRRSDSQGRHSSAQDRPIGFRDRRSVKEGARGYVRAVVLSTAFKRLHAHLQPEFEDELVLPADFGDRRRPLTRIAVRELVKSEPALRRKLMGISAAASAPFEVAPLPPPTLPNPARSAPPAPQTRGKSKQQSQREVLEGIRANYVHSHGADETKWPEWVRQELAHFAGAPDEVLDSPQGTRMNWRTEAEAASAV